MKCALRIVMILVAMAIVTGFADKAQAQWSSWNSHYHWYNYSYSVPPSGHNYYYNYGPGHSYYHYQSYGPGGTYSRWHRTRGGYMAPTPAYVAPAPRYYYNPGGYNHYYYRGW